MNPEVDHYLAEGCGRCPLGGTADCKVHSWTEELKLLRAITLESGLHEERKWGVPCYTFEGNNVAVVSALKNYCSISFFKGALLKDSKKILEKPGENTQAARLLKFTSVDQIIALEPEIRAYLQEALEIEKSGKKVDFKQKNELEYPEEFQSILDDNPRLEAAFEALTPGRKRGYILHFSQPKQSSTRISRIEKCIEKILNGKGFHDR